MNFRRNLTLVLLLATVASPLRTTAQPTADAPADAAKERFLVIVETSAAMQKRAENLQKAVGSVISSGLNKQIGEGSTIGLWTFNEKLYTGQLPLQSWTEANRQRVALTLVQFLQQQKYEKNSRLATIWDAATNIVTHSERITILLFTTGSDAITGTPFDAAITESYIRNQEQLKKLNMPFLTILRAVKGEFVTFAVNMPPWPLEVPNYPDGFKPVRAKPTEIAETKATPPAPTPRRVDPAVLSPTNTIFLSEHATNEPPTLVAPSIAAAPPNPPASTKANPAPTNVADASNAAQPPAPTHTAPTPTAAQNETTPANRSAEQETRTKFPIATLLIAGIALLLGVMLTFIALLRLTRRTTGASLITQSMNKDHR